MQNETGIFHARIGYSNVVLLKNSETAILVDTGVKGNLNHILHFLKHRNVTPTDIRLIVLTHTHHDHTGNLHHDGDIPGRLQPA